MAFPWFRMYYEARTDAKLRSLADDEFRVWFNLLCMAAEQDAERGSLDMTDPFIVAVEVAGGDEQLLSRACHALSRLKIVTCDDVTLAFIKFPERQYDKPSDRPEETRKRQARSRAKSQQSSQESEVSRDVTRSHDPDTDTDTDTEEITNVISSAQSPEKVRRATGTPERYEPNAVQYEWALTKFGLDRSRVDLETEKFLDHHRARGSTMKNWDAAWQNWMRRAPEFAPRGRGGAPTQSVDGKPYHDGTQWRRADGLVI